MTTVNPTIARDVILTGALILAGTLIPAGPAAADGGFFAPWINEIWEHEQVALLDWQADRNVETLTVLPGFHGDMQEFAWVVPVPAEPVVRSAPRALFEDLFDATREIYRQRDEGWSCAKTDVDYAVLPPEGGVDVLQRELVGIYDVMVLAADQAASLTDSLEAWGYLHEGNREQAEPILADYVARQWVFVTLRVDSTAFAESFPEHWPGEPWYGGMEPIELEFSVEAPVYPLRISAVSTVSRARVSVFTCADQRLDFDGAITRYANRFGADELASLRTSAPELAARLQPGRFLTRLERRMSAGDMTADLQLTVSAQQDEFRPIRYSSSADVWGFLLSVLAVLALGRWHAAHVRPDRRRP